MADITVVGNITNPELKFTSNGKAVLNFSLAENHRRNNNGTWEDDGTTWRKVAVWERAAEVLADSLEQGQRVIVVGQERLREFDAKDGSKGKSLELTAKHVGIVPKAPQDGFQQSQRGGYQQAPQGGYQQQGQPQQAQQRGGNPGWQYGDGAQQGQQWGAQQNAPF